MKFFLLLNVGSNDIWKNNRRIDKEKIRGEGKEILDNLELYKDKISFPIIQPYLNAFSEKISRIFLFVTDQQDERYSKQDTIYFGEILKIIIEERFKIPVEVKRYCGNPMNFEQVMIFYSEIMKKIKENNIIISISGGIPLMNYALLISSLFLFNSLIIYRVDEKSKKLEELDYKSVKKIFLKSTLREFIETYDYTGALKILENNKFFLEFRKFKLIKSLIEYLIERLHFNFEKARILAEEILNDFPEINKDLLFINDSNEKYLLYELYSNMAIKWYRGEIVDFMTRLYRFIEAYFQYLFDENIGKINWNEKKEKIKIDFNRILEEKEIKEKVIEKFKEAKKNCGNEVEPTKLAIIFALEVCNIKRSKVLDFLNTLVDKYRHKSIAGHWYKGLSKEEIKREVKEDLIEKIKKNLITPLNLSEEIIFDRINKEILLPFIYKL